MNFPFSVEKILPAHLTIVESKNSSPSLAVSNVTVLDTADTKKVEEISVCILSPNVMNDGNLREIKEHLKSIIAQMGLASAKAQELFSPITTFEKLLNSSQQKLYIMRDTVTPNSVIGILKTGLKKLFVCDDYGVHHEVDANCILDFYVHESKQRCGFGYELFNAMLKIESIEPSKLAIDRPSYKFLEFLKKHYNLTDPKPQPNKFVVYSDFFSTLSSSSSRYQTSTYSNYSFTKATPPKGSSFNDMKSRLYTPPANCHNKEKNNGIDAYFRKRRSSCGQTNQTPSYQFNKNEKRESVYDVLHNSSNNDNSFEHGGKQTSLRSLNSVRNENLPSQKKLDQLQSSWNVLGVKPLDYSMDQTNS